MKLLVAKAGRFDLQLLSRQMAKPAQGVAKPTAMNVGDLQRFEELLSVDETALQQPVPEPFGASGVGEVEYFVGELCHAGVIGARRAGFPALEKKVRS
jgi:hypothetical protein